MKKKIIALLGLTALVSGEAGAVRRSNMRASGTNNVNVRGMVTSINASASETTQTSSDYTKIAAVTDAVAKRKCDAMVVVALRDYCGKNKCKNATEVYANLTLPTDTSDVNEVYCANFIENAVNNLWNSYDSYALNQEKNCNIAMARSLAAEACYRYVLTNQNAKVIISEDELNDLCGAGAVKTQYARLSDGGSISDDEAGSDLPAYFSNIGNIGWSNLMAYTRLLDLKVDFKTTEFPRELIQLVNSLKSQGNMMCGEKHYSDLYDANIQLIDKTGSWEKKVKEEGIIKGSADWFGNQVDGVKSIGNTINSMFGSGQNAEEQSQQQQPATQAQTGDSSSGASSSTGASS